MWFPTPHGCDGHPCLPELSFAIWPWSPRSGSTATTLRPLATLGISLGVGIPLRLPGDDAQAAPDSATSKPTSLAERRAGGMLRSQGSGTHASPTLPGRAVAEQPGDLDGPLPRGARSGLLGCWLVGERE